MVKLTPEEVNRLAKEGFSFRKELEERFKKMSNPTNYKQLYEQEKEKNKKLTRVIKDLHWGARRYFDFRRSYGTKMFNDYTRELLAMGIELNPTADGTIWARDGMGRNFDGLTEEEAKMGEKK